MPSYRLSRASELSEDSDIFCNKHFFIKFLRCTIPFSCPLKTGLCSPESVPFFKSHISPESQGQPGIYGPLHELLQLQTSWCSRQQVSSSSFCGWRRRREGRETVHEQSWTDPGDRTSLLVCTHPRKEGTSRGHTDLMAGSKRRVQVAILRFLTEADIL